MKTIGKMGYTIFRQTRLNDCRASMFWYWGLTYKILQGFHIFKQILTVHVFVWWFVMACHNARIVVCRSRMALNKLMRNMLFLELLLCSRFGTIIMVTYTAFEAKHVNTRNGCSQTSFLLATFASKSYHRFTRPLVNVRFALLWNGLH